MEALTVTESIQHAVIIQYFEGNITLEEACHRLQLHRTTFWRKCQRFKDKGPGLVPSDWEFDDRGDILTEWAERRLNQLFRREDSTLYDFLG